MKVRVRNEIPNIEVAKEVACDNDKLERALIETYNGVTIEEILNALIDSRKKGMTLPTTQPMEHLVMYYALKGRKGLTLDEKQRILREVKSEKARDKEIVKRVLDKINEENRKNNVSVNANKIEAKKEEKNAIETKEEAVEPVDKLDKQLVRNVAGNNYYLERAILLGSFNGTKLEDILDGIIKLRKNGEDIACTREMNYLVDSYAIFGKLNANILNSTLDKIANVRKEEEKTKKEPVNEEKIEDKNIDSNIELAKEQAHGRQAQNAQHTCKPECRRMGNVLNHTVNTHHITRLVLLNNGTGNIEQHEFNHGMAIHMQHYRLDGQSGKSANTGYHNADIFHGGISQNTLYVALHYHEGHCHCHS